MKKIKPILAVDDDPSMLEFLKSVLEALGYTVKTASDGHEALHWLMSSQPSLILLDMVMPGLDGFSLLRDLRHRWFPGTPVVVMTALDDARYLAKDLQADGWLQKPFDLDALLDVVERLAA